MKPNPYLKHQNPWRWDIHTQVFLRAGSVVVLNRSRENALRSRFEERSLWWQVDEIEYIYPVMLDGGHYWSPNKDVEVSLRADDQKLDPMPQRLQTPESHIPYIWWRSRFTDTRIRQLHFRQISHVVCAVTVFDEQLAKQIQWPYSWPEEAERFLTPVVDPIQGPVDLPAQDHLTKLVDRWMDGNDPRSIDEVTLAKFLTGKVIEHVRVGRSSLESTVFFPTLYNNTTSSNDIEGFAPTPSDAWAGYNARSADQVAVEPLGSALDLSTMLVAVLRTAGVPARLLICYDKSNRIDPLDRIRGMVEFAMYDKDRDQVLWIPIDPQLLKDNGRRSNTYEQRWDYFGTHDRLRNFVPLAYYLHPPVSYNAFGYPGLYGFRVQPERDVAKSALISIDVMNSPIKAEDLKKPKKP